jgi:hypothetical protein
MKKNKDKYAIIILKDNSVIQVRTLNSTQEHAVEQAKLITKYGAGKFDNVIVYKTVEHKS